MAAVAERMVLAPAEPTPREVVGGEDTFGFPRAIKVGDAVYVGLQTAEAGGASIEVETAAAFDRLVSVLEAAGSGMADLVNLRTYYVYSGAGGRDVTDYWERMTAVRLRYLADPGPAATAVRVAGAPDPSSLIGVDGVASLDPARQRIMPAHAWDWSISTPFSQGWRAGEKVLLGGQISADRQGAATAVGDIAQQTRNTLEYIRHVLADGGAGFEDLATLRVCYSAGASAAEGRANLDAILEVIRQTLPAPLPAVTAFGVDLLYEGLLLEIDGLAVKASRRGLDPAGAQDWIGFPGFGIGSRCGREVLIGALSAPGAASLAAQTEATLDRLARALRAADADFDSLVKLTVYYAPDEGGPAAGHEAEVIADALAAHLPKPGPVLSIIRAAALPHPGQLFQLDAVAVL